MTFTPDSLRRVFRGWATTMAANKEELIRLDSVAGDSDLGLTMTDGFAAGAAAADAYEGTDLGMLTYTAGKALMAKAPSSLGTLLGSGFLRAGMSVRGKESLDGEAFIQYLDAFAQGIMDRGHAKLGDKTFLDGFIPAIEAFRSLKSNQDKNTLLAAAARAARAGSNNTANMVAQHGRMAVRGNDSLGMIDPGSVVAALMFESLAESLR